MQSATQRILAGKHLWSAMIILAAFLATRGAAQVPPEDRPECPEPTRTAVVERADRFLRGVAAVWAAIRVSPPAAATSECISVRVAPTNDDPRWGPVWEADYGPASVTVRVGSGTQTVVAYLDTRVLDFLGRLRAPEPPEQISPDTAIGRAVRYLHLAGVALDDLVPWYVAVSDTTDRADGTSRQYTVIFKRVWSGVPFRYEDQRVTVLMDARHGLLIGFGAVLAAVTPAQTGLSVSPETAVSIARDMLSSLESVMQPAGPSNVQLQVVLPNGIWPDWKSPRSRSEMPTTLQARLAWVVETPTRNPGARVEVWVDTVDGSILGGAIKVSMGRAEPPAEFAALKAAFASCRRLTLASVGSSKGSSGAVTATRSLSPEKCPLPFYGALADLTPWPPGRPAPPLRATHRLGITLKDGRTDLWDYDARNGTIGRSKKVIARAGVSLRQWVSPVRWSPAGTGAQAAPAP